MPEMSQQQERRWTRAIIVAAVTLASVPFLFGMLRASSTYAYLALNPFGPADTNVYFSFMQQAAQGHVFLANLHSAEPQNGSLFHPLWLVLGWAAGVFHLSMPLVFHLARVAAGIALLTVLVRFLRQAFAEPSVRILALLLLAFSSGIGTVFSVGVSLRDMQQILLLLPTDQWVPESNTFLTLVHSPLFILSQLLLVLILWALVRPDSYRHALFLPALVTLLGLLHPYDLVTLAVVGPVVVLVWWWRALDRSKFPVPAIVRTGALSALGAGCVLGYFTLIGKIEPVIAGWTKQNITLSPPVHNYLLGYGLLIPLGVVGWTLLRRSRRPEHLLLLTWAAFGPVLLYLPFAMNRRLSNGLHIPLAILAAVGLHAIGTWVAHRLLAFRWRRQIVLAMLGWIIGLGLFFSTLFAMTRAVYWEWKPEGSIYYTERANIAAMQWLARTTPADAIVLSHPYTGNILPAVTGRRVYVGHGHQTVGWLEKVHTVTDWFFRTNRDDAAKQEFLRSNRIGYLFYGPNEKHLGMFAPSEKPYLTSVYANKDVTIYRVTLP